MKKTRILAMIMSMLLMLTAFAACSVPEEASSAAPASSEAPASSAAPAESTGKKIGFSVYDMQYEFFQSMEKGTKAGVEALGYEYILHDQKSDETQMVTGAINLIDQGVDALIISPCKPEALSSIIDAAKAKNVPVVVDDIGGGGTAYDAIVISDCYQGGQQAADYTAELLAGNEGSKKVAIIKCEPSAVYAIRRGEGYKANITAAGFNVIKELSGHSKSEEGYTIMQDILASDPDVVAVFAENDPMAVGAANALADAGRNDVIVIGFNGDGEAIDAMAAGTMQGTVAQDPEAMGKLTAELADKLVKGETLKFDNEAEREIFAPVTLIKGDGSPAAAVTPTGGKIGFSVYDMQYEFFQSMEKGTKAGVEALGYEYILHDQKSDETQMVTGAINLIDQGVDALIISPCKPEALSSIIDAAKAKNVPVVVDDIGGGGTAYDAIVISDCYQGGQQAADYTAELLAGNEGSKKVAIIKCEPSAVYAIRRGEGYKANITAAGFNVIKELSGHSKSEEGYTIMQDILASDPDVVAVFAENDPMAVGAANALADAGRSDVVVIGFNGDGEAIDAMAAGTMQGTVAQDPEAMGKLTAELADKLVKGEALKFDNDAEREIYAPVKLIKASN